MGNSNSECKSNPKYICSFSPQIPMTKNPIIPIKRQKTFKERIVQAETEILLLTGISLAYITRKDVSFVHDEEIQEKVKIRTFIIDDSEDIIPELQKPTLVIIHGFASSFVQFYTILKPLMHHYRIVGIDQLGFGASSRVTLDE